MTFNLSCLVIFSQNTTERREYGLNENHINCGGYQNRTPNHSATLPTPDCGYCRPKAVYEKRPTIMQTKVQKVIDIHMRKTEINYYEIT